MFKKPLCQVKTSAPLRASDRRKLKQRVLSMFREDLSSEDGDLLVPEGIQSAKFLTHIREPGLLYLDPTTNNPLFFTVGKNSEDLNPTIYTLWKLPCAQRRLLPAVLVPAAVIPVLANGADLMIPGVISHVPDALVSGQLVAIHQLTTVREQVNSADDDDSDKGDQTDISNSGITTRMVSAPLAIGRMALSSEELRRKKVNGEKGKAAIIFHAWNDCLCEIGQKGQVPPAISLTTFLATNESMGGEKQEDAGGNGEDESGYTSSGIDPSWLTLLSDLEGKGVSKEVIAKEMDFIRSFMQQNETGRDIATSADMPASWLTLLSDLEGKGVSKEVIAKEMDFIRSFMQQNETGRDIATSVDMPASSTELQEPELTPKLSYTPEENTALLLKSLVHAIATQLSTLPASSFPIPSSQLYTNYILPSRPAFPTSVLLPSSALDLPSEQAKEIQIDPLSVTIKSSSHKSLTTFLKAAEKSSLLTLKVLKGGEVLITAVNVEHKDVVGHKVFVTLRAIEEREAKKAERKEKEEEEKARAEKEIAIREVWKPHLASIALFEEMGASTSELYTLNEIRQLLKSYVTKQQLVNAQDRAFVNLNTALTACITSNSGKGKKKASQSEPSSAVVAAEFIKRDELMKRVVEQMQPWYEVRMEGKEPVMRKGEIKPIQISVKSRTGKRAYTQILGFEPFLVVDAEDMAEHLRRVCASATSVSPIPDKHSTKVQVQGRQGKAAMEYLIGRGVPKKWIEVNDVFGNAKK